MASIFVRLVAGVVLVLALVACPSTTGGVVQDVAIVGGDRSLIVGASVTLGAVVQATGGVSTAVVWSSDAPDVVVVDAVSGVAEALALGSAGVTATSTVDRSQGDTVTVTVDPDGVVRWTRQFGTSGADGVNAVAVDGTDRVLVAGSTSGDFEGASAGGRDAFVRSYDADGGMRWTRQFGTDSDDVVFGVAVDGSGRVYVVGTSGAGLDGVSAGGTDAFVRSYDAEGGLRWTRQFGTSAADDAQAVAVDGDGRVYVAGFTAGGLEGANAGGSDAFVRSYDADGGLRWTRQFGTDSDDVAVGAAVDDAGRVAVAGYTGGGLEGVNAGGIDAFLRSYDADGGLGVTRQFGTSDTDVAMDVAVDGTGRMTVVGYTGGGLEGASAGFSDAFVRSYDAGGGLRWTRQFGTGSGDFANGAAVDAMGRVYVAGHTSGGLEGANAGKSDAFARSYDAAGGLRWTRQFGTSSTDQLFALAADANGRTYVGGSTFGAVTGAGAGPPDAILRSYGP